LASQDSTPGSAQAATEASTAELLRGLADDASTLLRQEVLLARQELQEGFAARARASALLGAAAFLGLFAFFFLLYTVGEAIGGPRWLGFAIVTGVLLLVAVPLGLIGRRRLAASKVAPERAKAELQAAATDLKEELRWGTPRQQPPEKSN
jgi:Putative Actinobacterial Holin-X, holin superfamily III